MSSDSDKDDALYRPCVGLVIVNCRGQVFAGQRIDTVGAWQMPQGGIDAGETAEAAALRELMEETSIRLELVEVLARTPDWVRYDFPRDVSGKVWKGRYRGQKQIWFLLQFTGQDRDIDLATEHPEFSEWCWMSPAQVSQKIVEFKRSVYIKVLEGFAPQLDNISSEIL